MLKYFQSYFISPKITGKWTLQEYTKMPTNNCTDKKNIEIQEVVRSNPGKQNMLTEAP